MAYGSFAALTLWQIAYGIWRVERKEQVRRCEMAFRFEELEIFHLAVDFAAKISAGTKSFPGRRNLI